MRRKIATWSIERLKAYISETVFFQAMGCLLPIVYLTAESTQCLGPRNELEGHILEKCGGVLVPRTGFWRDRHPRRSALRVLRL